MGLQKDKKIQRFVNNPTDYSFEEMDALLKSLGHHLKKGGMTAGSAAVYVNKDGEQSIFFHRPHKHKHFGKKVMKSVYEQVRDHKLIEDYIN
jgi:hypothetical protein